MGTCWLFCLAASALSSGRAAEEEEGEDEEGGALGLKIWKEKEVRMEVGRGGRGG